MVWRKTVFLAIKLSLHLNQQVTIIRNQYFNANYIAIELKNGLFRINVSIPTLFLFNIDEVMPEKLISCLNWFAVSLYYLWGILLKKSHLTTSLHELTVLYPSLIQHFVYYHSKQHNEQRFRLKSETHIFIMFKEWADRKDIDYDETGKKLKYGYFFFPNPIPDHH